MRRATHYDALSLARDATPEQIEKAYHFFAEMYDDAALATYSLLDAEQQREARGRIRQAYEVLRDPLQRELYDRSLEEATAAASAAERHRAPQPAAARPPAAAQPAAGAHAQARLLAEPVTGESLRRAREERRVSLQDIATSTKIGVRFLEYIEADRHGDLPAVVYIRGFVQEYARCIGLDPRTTAESYLKRVKPQG
ncbi:MAG TPA: helix-turn-helix domain-containing protein [Vicinamibacteria bacterium]|nr:helix-turn-helix domain-containing protein [Vicinamibacteria bacterium]